MLNETQRSILESTIGMNFDIFEEDCPLGVAIQALEACVNREIFQENEAHFQDYNIVESITQIHRVLDHPNPQNRMVNYPYFDAPQDSDMVVYADEDGNEQVEPKGLLGLSARNDESADPVTKRDVVRYIQTQVQVRLAGLQKELLRRLEQESMDREMAMAMRMREINRKGLFFSENPEEIVQALANAIKMHAGSEVTFHLDLEQNLVSLQLSADADIDGLRSVALRQTLISLFAFNISLNEMLNEIHIPSDLLNARQVHKFGDVYEAVYSAVSQDRDSSFRISGSQTPPFTTPLPAPEPAGLQQLLNNVVQGKQKEVEILLKNSPALSCAHGDVTDLSGRTFQHITAFQYALWAKDWHMWRMIKLFMPEEVQREQCEEILTSQAPWVIEHGQFFDLQPLIDALQVYIKGYANWDDNQRNEFWCKTIGGLQRQLPIHVINEYCRSDRSFQPTPNFKDSNELPRHGYVNRNGKEYGVDWCFQGVHDGGKLGETWALCRSGKRSRRAQARHGHPKHGRYGWPVSDAKRSLESLSHVRQEQTEELLKSLNTDLTQSATTTVISVRTSLYGPGSPAMFRGTSTETQLSVDTAEIQVQELSGSYSS